VISTLEGYYGAALTYLTLAADPHYSNDQRSLVQKAGKACRDFDSFAAVFAMGRPRAALCRGHYEWITGRSRKGLRTWQKGLALAQQLEMPYDAGLILYQIGTHLPFDDPRRAHHLVRAAETFDQIQADHERSLIQPLLESPG
jgi:hypothetical protein